ncbi:MAG: metal-dependent hydrolase [Opitutaceae bacterium]
MDPLTHVLLGASLGYVTFGKKLGRTAALAGGLAAFAPDADVFIRSSVDPLLAIEHHRGFTHSLSFAPVGAAFAAGCWLFRPAWRTRRWLTLWCCCLFAYISHELLDAATTYGTQLLWPFSRHRAGWDIISIIDPLFTLVLLIGLTGALVTQRRVSASAALLVCVLYAGFGAVQHRRAASAQRALAAVRGHRIERAEVMPTLANNIVWRALYEHDRRIFNDRIRVGWFSAASVREGWSAPLVRQGDLTPAEAARNTRESFERFAWFSNDWLARSPADPSVLADMRYSLSTEAFDPIWGIRFTPADAATEVTWVNRSRDRQIEPGELWNEIIGRDERFRALR